MVDMHVDKKKLEIILEETPDYRKPKKELEQYPTPPEIASKILWEALLRNDIEDKTILDLGCGTLRLGIGALILGARRVVGVDIDYGVLEETREWLEKKKYTPYTLLVNSSVEDIQFENIDTTIMNPPFGVNPRNRGLDMMFLKKALELSKTVYTIHKHSPGEEKLVKEIAYSMKYTIVYREKTLLPIKMMYPRHRRRVYRVEVDIYGLKKGESEENEYYEETSCTRR